MANRNISYGIKFQTDKQGLNDIKKSLQEIQNMTRSDYMNLNKSLSPLEALRGLNQLKDSAKELETAFQKAFNADLGTVNINKLQKELSKLDIDDIYKNMSTGGQKATNAFRDIATEASKTNIQLTKTRTLLDDMFETLSNTLRWNLASSAINSVSGEIQKAYYYVKDLDRSLNDIRIVTGNSAEEMSKFAETANNAAQNLAKSTTDYTNASLIYYQQGLADAEVQARTEVTLKAANVTQQSTDQVSEQLTAVWNGYKVSADEAESYVDKLAAVAASTASDLEELSTGMSKVASAAASTGVDIDQLNAQIATIVSVTRQAPESVGTALKTVYARLGDLQINGVDEFGVTLGEVSGKMEQMGIQILDENGNLREMGTVIEETAKKWETWTSAQRQAAAVAMAGKRQYSNLISLFDNWDMYTNALETSKNSLGTLNEQQNIYLDGIQAHIQQTKTAFEGFFDSLVDENTIKDFADGFTVIGNGLETFVDSLGGGNNLLLTLGSTATMVFSQQIATGLSNIINKGIETKNQINSLKQEIETMKTGEMAEDPVYKNIIRIKEELAEFYKFANKEELGAINNILDEANNLKQQEAEIKEAKQAWEETQVAAENYFKSLGQDAKFNMGGKLVGEEAKENFILLQENGEVLANRFKEVKNQLNSLGDIDSLDKIKNKTDELINASKTLLEGLLTENVEVDKLGQEYQELVSAIDLYEGNLDGNGNFINSDNIEEVRNLLNEVLEKVRLAKDSATTGAAQVEEIINRAEQENENFGIQIRNNQKAAKELHDRTRQMANEGNRRANIQAIVGVAGALGQVASSVQTVNSLMDTWSDETISHSDKMIQTFTSMSMILGTLPTTFNNITQGVNVLAKALGLLSTGPLFAIGAGIAALVAGYELLIAKKERDVQITKEQNKETIENAEKIKTEQSNIESLKEKYDDLYNTYKTTGEAKEELKEVSNELIKLLDPEGNSLKLLGENYDALTNKINQNIEAKRKATQESLQAAREAAASQALLEGGDQINGRTSISFNGRILGSYQEENFATQALKSSFEKNNVQYGLADMSHISASAATIDEFLSMYNAVQEATNEISQKYANQPSMLNNSNVYQEMKKWLSDNQKNIESYNSYITDLKKQVTEAMSDTARKSLTTFNSLDSFEVYYKNFQEQFKDALRQAGVEYSKEELKQMVDESLSSVDELAKYVSNHNIAETIYSALSSNKENTNEEIESFIQELEDEDTFDIAAELVFDSKQTVEEAKYQAGLAKQAAQEAISAEGLNILSQVSDALKEDGLDKLFDDSKAGIARQELFDRTLEQVEGIRGLTTAMEEWSSVAESSVITQIEYIQDLIEKQIEEKQAIDETAEEVAEKQEQILKVQQERLKQEAADAAEELERIREKFGEDSDEYENAKSQYDSIADKLENVKNKAKDLEEQLSTGEWQINLDIQGAEDIITLGDSVIAESEKIRQAAELIGEGYKVAADDVKNLRDVFPEVLENATVLHDGTVQLSKDIVKQTLGDQKTILNGDIESTNAKIENKIIELEAARDEAQLRLELAEAVAAGEVSLDGEEMEALMTNDETLAKYKENLDAEVTNQKAANLAIEWHNQQQANENEIKASKDKADTSKKNSDIINEHQRNIIRGEHEIAKSVRDSMNGIISGNEWFAGKNLGGATSGTNKMELWQAQYVENLQTQKQNAKEWQTRMKSQITRYNQEIAKLRAYQIQLRSNANRDLNSITDAQNGIGGKTTSSKQSKSKTTKKKTTKKKTTKKSDNKDLNTYEVDDYHDINVELELIAVSLKKLQQQQDKLVGKDLLNNLKQQLSILEKQKEAQERKLEIAKTDLAINKEYLKQNGAIFNNKTGEVSNYYDYLEKISDKYNNAIIKYNGMSAEQQEKYKETLEFEKTRYEEAKKALEEYDKLLTKTIPDVEDSIEETLNKEVELNIKKFTMNVELKLDIAEATREFNNFKKKIVDDIQDNDFLNIAKAQLKDLDTYYSKGENGAVQALTTQLKDTLQELKEIDEDGTSDIYGDNKAKALEDLQNYYKELMTQLEDVENLVDDLGETYLKTIDKAKEKLEEQATQYEYISDLVSHNISLINLVYGDTAYDKLTQYYDKQELNNNKQLDFYRKEVDMWKKRMNAEEVNSEAWEKYKDNWQNAVKDLNSLIEDSIQNLLTKYENMVNKVMKDVEDRLTKGKGLDSLKEEWDLINETSDAYLDNINAMYETQALENKFNDAINSTQSLSAQQKLKEVMDEQLGILRDKDKLTQYDVDRANKIYDLTMKQIALENSQKNKSQMRLRRDSQGNYSYQYVSDSDAIAQSQQELAEAQNSLYNFDKDKYKNNLNDMYKAYNDYSEKVKELYSDLTLSDEEREQKRLLYSQQYNDLIALYTEQNEDIKVNLMDSAIQEMAQLYNTNIENFKAMTDEEKNIWLQDLVPEMKSGMAEMADAMNGPDGVREEFDEAFSSLENMVNEYKDSLSDLEESANVNFDSIADGYDKTIDETENLLRSNEELINGYNQEMDAVKNVVNTVEELVLIYKQAKEEAIAATDAAYKYWKQKRDVEAAENKSNNRTNNGGNSNSGGNGNSSNGSNGSSTAVLKRATSKKEGGNGKTEIGDRVTYVSGDYHEDSYGNGRKGHQKRGQIVKITHLASGHPYPVHIAELGGGPLGWLKKNQIKGFDTGGYTGAWGSSGKVAMLHEKELVLNKQDTKNILDATKITRDFSGVISALAGSLGNRLSGLSSLIQTPNSQYNITNSSGNNISQQVQITATFEDVRSAREIETAFTNLINRASQTTNSNKR